jgi:hypothetical protein
MNASVGTIDRALRLTGEIGVWGYIASCLWRPACSGSARRMPCSG